jgi:hypothetical protein
MKYDLKRIEEKRCETETENETETEIKKRREELNYK